MFRWIHTWTCWRPCPILVEPLRQLIKESINQSIHPSINQSINQSTNQPNHPDRSIQFSSIQSKWSQSDHQIIRSSATCTSPPPQIFVHSKPLADRPVLKSFDIIAMTPKKAHQAKCPNSAVFSTTYCFQNYHPLSLRFLVQGVFGWTIQPSRIILGNRPTGGPNQKPWNFPCCASYGWKDQSPKWPLASRIEERWRPKRLAVLPRCPPCVSREVPREVGWALGPPPNLAGSLVKGVFQTKPFITRKKIP